MKAPLRLRRTSSPRSGDALLILGHDIARLLEVCKRLPTETEKSIFSIDDGFLVCSQVPPGVALPGAIRLRALAPNFYLPVDAELTPALLEDEAKDLARRQGLVALPPDKLLSFELDRPIPIDRIVRFGPIERREWQPFPTPISLADRLLEIIVEPPALDPEDLLGSSDEQQIGVETPRPEGAGVMATALGSLGLTFGQFLARLGRLLRLRRMAAQPC
jgi:hypothetical protein